MISRTTARPFHFCPSAAKAFMRFPSARFTRASSSQGTSVSASSARRTIDLKIRLYFTHKGTEKLFEGRLPAEGVELAERISGDTTVGHALACARRSKRWPGPKSRNARDSCVILLEMERLYNHIADFGMIANDTGFAFAHAHCFRCASDCCGG